MLYLFVLFKKIFKQKLIISLIKKLQIFVQVHLKKLKHRVFFFSLFIEIYILIDI